jgi:hypothetical protein
MRSVFFAYFLLTATAAADEVFDLTCSPVPTGSAQASADPINTVRVFHEGKEWRIAHLSLKGRVYRREDQYLIVDDSTPGAPSWRGAKRNNSSLRMHGLITWSDQAYRYDEILRDDKNGALNVANTIAICKEGQAPPPPVQATNPSTSALATQQPNQTRQPSNTIDLGPETEMPSRSLTVKVRHSDYLAQILIIAKVDEIYINKIVVNRGNCSTNISHTFPKRLRFGERFEYGYFINCVPIEIEFRTNIGSATFDFGD